MQYVGCKCKTSVEINSNVSKMIQANSLFLNFQMKSPCYLVTLSLESSDFQSFLKQYVILVPLALWLLVCFCRYTTPCYNFATLSQAMTLPLLYFLYFIYFFSFYLFYLKKPTTSLIHVLDPVVQSTVCFRKSLVEDLLSCTVLMKSTAAVFFPKIERNFCTFFRQKWQCFCV